MNRIKKLFYKKCNHDYEYITQSWRVCSKCGLTEKLHWNRRDLFKPTLFWVESDKIKKNKLKKYTIGVRFNWR